MANLLNFHGSPDGGSTQTAIAGSSVVASGFIAIGVKGHASGGTTNWAGYFQGGNVKVENDLDVDGTITADSYGHIYPATTAIYDIGSTALRWRNIYTTDLQLSNLGREEGNKVDGTKGDWTLQEGEEDLFVINNVSGKKYKIALIPTEDT